jgi:hypothetical protein
MLGLKSGFCACFDKAEVARILNINNPLLTLGIGYPDTTKLRRENQDSSHDRRYFSSHEKPITITTIGEDTTVYRYDGVLPPKAHISTVTLTAPSRQEIKNQSDLTVLPQQFQDEAINFLYRTGVEYSVEPHPYIEQWNSDQTAIAMSWTEDDKGSLDNFINVVKQYLETELRPIGWTVT